MRKFPSQKKIVERNDGGARHNVSVSGKVGVLRKFSAGKFRVIELFQQPSFSPFIGKWFFNFINPVRSIFALQ